MTDESVREVIEGILRNTRELGPSPLRFCLEYLERTAPVIENNVRPSPPLLRGDAMIVVELPKETFERMVLNDRLYRRLNRNHPLEV